MMMYNAARESAEWVTRSEKNRLLPDLAVEYFQGTNSLSEAKIYRGFEVGIAIPLFFGAQRGRIRSGSIQENITEKEKANYFIRLKTEQEQLVNQLAQIRNALEYYESNGRNLARELIRASQRSYQEGEINYFQYIQNVDSAVRMEISYLENVLQQNLTSIALFYLAPDP
jgi:cobalt-zinc-cadmium resistance protein CzcA